MSPQKQRRTFISYSRSNKEFALELALELRASGFDVWLDILDIPTGSRWDDEVEQALEACEIFMVILTPASSKSDNVKDEIGYAIDTGKRILPILLENAKVPLRLRRFQYVDFTRKSYDEGVEGAKQLLRRLIEEPTVPRDQTLEEMEAQIAERGEIEDESELMAEEEIREEESIYSPEVISIPQKQQALVVSPTKKSRSPLFLGVAGVGAFVVLGFVAFSLVNRSSGGNLNADILIDNPVSEQTTASPAAIIVEVELTSTQEPTQTQKVDQPTSTLEPTTIPETPTPEVQKFFMEEFDGDLSSWQTNFTIDAGRSELLVTPYDDQSTDVKFGVNDGFFQFDLFRRVIIAYSIYDPFVYNDVRIDVRVDSQSIHSSNVSLICRYSPEGGWYEFNIANNGEYSIKMAQPRSNGVIRYTDLWSGSFSRNVRTGNAINEYSIVCQGYDLSLYINGELERQTSDIQRTLRTGKVGISASSLNDLPVNIGYDWVKISEPE
jgi:hypothetical protein